MFKGSFTALITPFKGSKVDEDAFVRLVEWQIKEGTHGLVPCGTTGESPTLSTEEHKRVIALCIETAKKRVPIVAGCGSNSTEEAIDLTRFAKDAGADATLQVMPYYNKPTQEGLFQHFKAIAAETELPLILYSIPGRCGVEIAVDTVKRLAGHCPNIVAIKEAGGSCDRVSQLRAALDRHFNILSGDDSLTLPFMSVGAEGVISVASNLIPREVSHMVDYFRSGRPDAALKLHAKFYPLFKDLFIETNPVPVKAALAMLGQVEENYRLPLVRMSAKNRAVLQATMKACGVLK